MAAIPEERQPGRFIWRQCGRAFVTNFGHLSVSVRRKGRRGVDLRWRVDEVFGAKFLAEEWHEMLDDAILEAEALAIREANCLYRNLLAARRARTRSA